jgi:hypothetical protein
LTRSTVLDILKAGLSVSTFSIALQSSVTSSVQTTAILIEIYHKSHLSKPALYLGWDGFGLPNKKIIHMEDPNLQSIYIIQQ